MFTKKELEATKDCAEQKLNKILENNEPFTTKTLRDLRTCLVLKEAAREKLEKLKK